MNRYFYRCVDCLSVAAAAEELAKCQCGACGGRVEFMGRVQRDRLVTDETASICDCRCTHARGPICNCKCGGAHHGSGLVVSIRRDMGPVPHLMIVDEKRARETAEFWRGRRAELAQAVHLLEVQQRSAWLDADDFSRLCKLRNAWGRADRARVHKVRMRIIAGVLGPAAEELECFAVQGQLF